MASSVSGLRFELSSWPEACDTRYKPVRVHELVKLVVPFAMRAMSRWRKLYRKLQTEE
jgi:hypothetical protein